ncbi:hypothetical protein Tco_0499550 [Tanacetum coccineum]
MDHGSHRPFKVEGKIDIPTYDGTIDAEKLDSWLDRLETYFTLYGFRNSDKVVFAQPKLTNHALAWWNSQLKIMGNEEISWKKFTQLLRQEFYPMGFENYSTSSSLLPGLDSKGYGYISQQAIPYLWERNAIYFPHEQTYQFENDGKKYLVNRNKGTRNVELITACQARRMVNASQVVVLSLVRPMASSNKVSALTNINNQHENITAAYPTGFEDVCDIPTNQVSEHDNQLIADATPPNIGMYRNSVLENDKIKWPDRHRVEGKFKEKDLIWLHLDKERLKGEGKKLKPIRYGPFQIVKKVGENACQLELPECMEMYSVANVDKLKLFEPSMHDEEPGDSFSAIEGITTDHEKILSRDSIVEGKTRSTRRTDRQSFRIRKRDNPQVQQKGSLTELVQPDFLISSFADPLFRGKGGRDTVQLETAVSTISQEYLLEFMSEFGISEGLHPELPARGDMIVDFPKGKVSVYTKFFEFANFRIPISQFLFNILGYYQIHLSQLSVIGAAKVSHFEIQCRVLNVIPTMNLFRVFYTPSFNAGWMPFSKRSGKNTPQCYTKPLDSLKNWNNRFFWVDEKVFPTTIDWRTSAPKDSMPLENTYSAEDMVLLNTCRTPIQRQPELLLCLVGLSRRYFLGDDLYPTFLYDDGHEMDLFNLISAPNPTVIKTGTRQRTTHEVPLLTATTNRVITMEDVVVTTTSSSTPAAIDKSPLDFSNEDATPLIADRADAERQIPTETPQEIPPTGDIATSGFVPEVNLEKDVAAMGVQKTKGLRKRVRSEAEANAPLKVLRTDHASVRPAPSTRGGKSMAALEKEVGATVPVPTPQEVPRDVMEPDPLSYARPQTVPEKDVAQLSKGKAAVRDPDSDRSTSFMSLVGSPGGIYQPGWGVANNCRLDTPEACQDVVDHSVPPGYFSELRHLPNSEFLA